MLKKLYKYDFLCSARKVVPVFIIYLMVTVLFKILNFFETDNVIFEGSLIITAMVFMFITFGLVIFGFGTAIARFKKNLFTDEGYLMHTLPVKPSQLIWSKLLNAFTWGFFCMVATVIGMCLMLFGEGLLGELSDFVNEIKKVLSTASALEIINLILVLINMLGFVVTLSLAGFAWTAFESSHPIMKKGGMTVLLTIVGVFVGFFIGIFYNLAVDGFVDVLELSADWETVFRASSFLLVELIISVGSFIWTCQLMEKKLNLE